MYDTCLAYIRCQNRGALSYLITPSLRVVQHVQNSQSNADQWKTMDYKTHVEVILLNYKYCNATYYIGSMHLD